MTWLYVFIVGMMLEWPGASITTQGCTPWTSSSEAQAVTDGVEALLG